MSFPDLQWRAGFIQWSINDLTLPMAKMIKVIFQSSITQKVKAYVHHLEWFYLIVAHLERQIASLKGTVSKFLELFIVITSQDWRKFSKTWTSLQIWELSGSKIDPSIVCQLYINAFYSNSIILFSLILKRWTYYESGILLISIFSMILLILAWARIRTCDL